jgi:pteridine reductase
MLNTPVKVAIVTGGAKRVGAYIVRTLHTQGFQVLIHCYQSYEAAQQLCQTLNQQRSDSAQVYTADLKNTQSLPQLIQAVIDKWGRLDVLINNAATFDAVPLEKMDLATWQSTLASNLNAPFFLSLAAAPYLRKTQGCIVNMADIRAIKPLKNYTAYCISKAGVIMMTKSLAKEWAPDIRVNAIAPGIVLWPDHTTPQEAIQQQRIIARTPLKRAGTPEDIAQTVLFLIQKAPYITGQTIHVEGGRLLA